MFHFVFEIYEISKSNQGNKESNGNQKNAIQGQRPDIENWQTQERINNNQNNAYKVTNVNEQLGIH